MKKLASFLPLLVVVVAVLLFTTVGCPSSGERSQTPGEAFLATLARIENRDFKSEWEWMSKNLQTQWARENDDLKAKIRADPGNRQVFDQMLKAQYELDASQFLEGDPRFLHARFLEINRQQILRYQVMGEARIEGDVAYLPVRMLKGEQTSEFRYVLVNGRWLLDEGKRSR